ncbi:cytochrome c3 family protein [Adhaeretor mobilis]|uniref:Doubled CXXCH motif n=1 Tax=Adhaeretor mobilis TaxID=1930276 RepID=A0A517N0G6_9BACT|nr:cytochrome c3 family protein [Adhaeretor mobilis]QDT00630.1 Doubled CXXCH motif [Adhaeretor mobilis]
MRGPLDPQGKSDYPRPNQPWQCGADSPCPLGPTAGGQCTHGSGCHPLQQGDRWLCNRSDLRGGTCGDGPTPDGKCCIQFRCTPVGSQRSRRGRWVVGIFLATVGCLLMLLSSGWRNEFIVPGPLSRSHATLIVGDAKEARCASCHAAGGATFTEWLQHTTGSAELDPTQAALCMNCHKETFSRKFALSAHNVPLDELQGKTTWGEEAQRTSEGRIDPADPIACSACHREHRGLEHSLTAMSNESCQACHKQTIDHFATDHPEFNDWPYRSSTKIAFDHATHSGKHFAKEKQEFACSACHVEGESGGQRTLGYEVSCASCHDAEINTSLAEGISLVSLPTLDVDLLAENGVNIGAWPQAANFDFDGRLSPVTRLLLASEPGASKAMSVLGSNFSFFDVDIEDPQQLKAAGDVVLQLKDLIEKLDSNGSEEIVTRAAKLVGRPLTLEEQMGLLANLSPSAIVDYRNRWFGQRKDASIEQPSSSHKQSGVWHRDDGSFALRYRPAGHADPWLRQWLDLTVESSKGEQANIASQQVNEMFAPTAPGLCSTCHTAERRDGKIVKIHWQAKQPHTKQRSFTHFSHTPHLTQQQLRDCSSCHRIEPNEIAAAAAAKQNFHYSGFAAMEKDSCATCHTSRAAGESCTQCHHYHVTAGGNGLVSPQVTANFFEK